MTPLVKGDKTTESASIVMAAWVAGIALIFGLWLSNYLMERVKTDPTPTPAASVVSPDH